MCIRNSGNYDQNSESSSDIYIKFHVVIDKKENSGWMASNVSKITVLTEFQNNKLDEN